MGRFYKDQNSHNIFQELISLSESASVPSLEEIKANTTDAAVEKHVPVVTQDGNKVSVAVSSVEHPMLPECWMSITLQASISRLNLARSTEDLRRAWIPRLYSFFPKGTSLLRHMNTVIYTDYGKKTITKIIGGKKSCRNIYANHVAMYMILKSEILTAESPRVLHSKIFRTTGYARSAEWEKKYSL